MNEVNFGELLNVNADDVKAPVPLPAGTYSLIVQNIETGLSREKKTPYIRFVFNVLAPGGDVDPAELTEIDLSKKSLRSEFYLTPDAMYRLVDFIKALGIETEGQNLRDLIPQTKGLSVNARVVQVPSQKPGDASIFNNVESFQSAA